MVDLADVSTSDLITSARANLINDYIQDGTHKINPLSLDIGSTEVITSARSLTNITFDANATGNTLSNVDLANDIIGTLPLANGGTGQTTQQTALDAIANSSSGTNGQVLTTDGTNASWSDSSGGGASMVFERKIEGDLYTTTLMPIVIADEFNTKLIKEVRLSVASLPTGSSLKVDVRKNGTDSTDSIFTSDTPIEIGTGQTATNGLYMVACDTSGARVGTPGNSIDSARDDLASDDVLWVVLTQCGSVLAGTDLVIGVSVE